MEHSLSWQTNRPSASPEILSILCIPKIPYRIRKSPSTASILIHIDSVHVLHPTPLGPILVLSSHLCLGLTTSLFPSGLPTKSSTHLSSKFATCATNLFPLLNKTRPLTNPRYIINQTYNLYGLTIWSDSHFAFFRLYQLHFTTEHLTSIVRDDVTYRYWIVFIYLKMFLRINLKTWQHDMIVVYHDASIIIHLKFISLFRVFFYETDFYQQ